MEIMTVFMIIAIAGLVLLLFKIIGKALSIALGVAGICLVVWLAMLGLKYIDSNEIRDKLLDSDNLFLLEDDETIITGFATLDDLDENVAELTEKLNNPKSDIYKKYFKIISVKMDSLPEDTRNLVKTSSGQEQLGVFRRYVMSNLLGEDSDDAFDRLVAEEHDDNIQVLDNSPAFRNGIKEMLGLE